MPVENIPSFAPAKPTRTSSNAISYSRMTTHGKCGLKYKWSYVDKVPVDRGEPGPALLRGTKLHDSAEHYVLGKIPQVDPELEFYAQWLHGLKENYDCKPEFQWGLTRDFEPCDFDSPDAYIRGIFDLAVMSCTEENGEGDIFEYKTGKIYDDHKLQREFYAIPAMLHFDWPTVKVSTVYFDQKKTHEETWTRDDIPAIKAKLDSKIHLMGLAGSWIPNPSWMCRFCDFSKDKGGPCNFG